MPVTLSVVNERFRRIMMMHPEVEALTATEQARYEDESSRYPLHLFTAFYFTLRSFNLTKASIQPKIELYIVR